MSLGPDLHIGLGLFMTLAFNKIRFQGSTMRAGEVAQLIQSAKYLQSPKPTEKEGIVVQTCNRN